MDKILCHTWFRMSLKGFLGGAGVVPPANAALDGLLILDGWMDKVNLDNPYIRVLFKVPRSTGLSSTCFSNGVSSSHNHNANDFRCN
uniref:Uncharacterized protein n=1 Tax=Romanomermis culicivorax TaxID=13658 RepID=A0A915HFM2_ROMCU